MAPEECAECVWLLYLNVYRVSQCYGGPEEGGWYYDIGEALASVPLRAELKEGHDSVCHRCNLEREGMEGRYGYCREVPQEILTEWDRHFNAGEMTEEMLRAQEQEYPLAHHLVPLDCSALEDKRKELNAMFAEYEDRRNYVSVCVVMEESFAKDYNTYAPYQ